MATTAPPSRGPQERPWGGGAHPPDVMRRAAGARARLAALGGGLAGFWRKLRHDWVFSLASLLAYNFILSAFPMVLLLLTLSALVLQGLSPVTYAELQRTLATLQPQSGPEL